MNEVREHRAEEMETMLLDTALGIVGAILDGVRDGLIGEDSTHAAALGVASRLRFVALTCYQWGAEDVADEMKGAVKIVFDAMNKVADDDDESV